MTLAETIELLKTDRMQITQPEKVVSVFGADALNWLQGQVTNDLSQLRKTEHIATCICNPTGQLLTTAHLYFRNGSIHIFTPDPDIFLDRIENFVVMEEVSASLVEMDFFSIQGLRASGKFERDRTGYGGFDSFIDNPGLPEIPEDHLATLEIAAGIPRFGTDTNPKTLPPELGPDFEETYISYTKGCYVGQEVLQRIHSRGHTNKTWVGLIADTPLKEGLVSLDGKDVGIVHRTANHPELGFIASATLRNEATDPGTEVTVGGTAAIVKPMPLLG